MNNWYLNNEIEYIKNVYIPYIILVYFTTRRLQTYTSQM